MHGQMSPLPEEVLKKKKKNCLYVQSETVPVVPPFYNRYAQLHTNIVRRNKNIDYFGIKRNKS